MKMIFLLINIVYFIFLSSSIYISPNSNCQFCDGTIKFPYPDIKTAINSLSPGQEVLILLNGNYIGINNTNIILSKLNLTITSMNGPDSVIIDCYGNSPGFSCDIGTYFIQNITINNCTKPNSGNSIPSYSGGAISINKGELYLTNMSILNSYASYGGGLACFTSICVIQSSKFVNNSVFKDGGAIYTSSSTLQILSNTEISNNFAKLKGAGVYSDSGTFNITGENINLDNNILSGNTFSGLTCKKVNINIEIYGTLNSIKKGTDCTGCSIIQMVSNGNSFQYECLCPGEYYSFTSKSCVTCPKNINTCQMNTSCSIQCQNNICLCVPGYYCDLTGGCSKCHSSCSTCIGATQFNCTNCSDINEILDTYPGQCIYKTNSSNNNSSNNNSSYNNSLNNNSSNNNSLSLNNDSSNNNTSNNNTSNNNTSNNNTSNNDISNNKSSNNNTSNNKSSNNNTSNNNTSNNNTSNNNTSNNNTSNNDTSNNNSSNKNLINNNSMNNNSLSNYSMDNNSLNYTILNNSLLISHNFSTNIDFNLFYTKQLNLIQLKFCDNYTILSDISMNNSHLNIESFLLKVDFYYFIEKQSITQYLIHLFYLKPLSGGKFLSVAPPTLNKSKTIKLFDFDQLDPEEIALLKSFSQQGEIIEIASKLMFLTNSLSSSSGGATPGVLRNMMLLELIFMLKFIDLNYPPNLIEFYIERTDARLYYLYEYKFDIDNEDELKMPPIYQLYNSSPYFLDNAFDLLLQSAFFFMIGLICLVILKNDRFKIKKKPKTQIFFMKILIKIIMIIKDAIVWEFSLLLFFTNFQEIFFRMICPMKFPTFTIYKGFLNFFFVIISLILYISILLYLFNISKNLHKSFLPIKYGKVSFETENNDNFFKTKSISWNPLKMLFGKDNNIISNKILPLENFEKIDKLQFKSTSMPYPKTTKLIARLNTENNNQSIFTNDNDNTRINSSRTSKLSSLRIEIEEKILKNSSESNRKSTSFLKKYKNTNFEVQNQQGNELEVQELETPIEVLKNRNNNISKESKNQTNETINLCNEESKESKIKNNSIISLPKLHLNESHEQQITPPNDDLDIKILKLDLNPENKLKKVRSVEHLSNEFKENHSCTLKDKQSDKKNKKNDFSSRNSMQSLKLIQSCIIKTNQEKWKKSVQAKKSEIYGHQDIEKSIFSIKNNFLEVQDLETPLGILRERDNQNKSDDKSSNSDKKIDIATHFSEETEINSKLEPNFDHNNIIHDIQTIMTNTKEKESDELNQKDESFSTENNRKNCKLDLISSCKSHSNSLENSLRISHQKFDIDLSNNAAQKCDIGENLNKSCIPGVVSLSDILEKNSYIKPKSIFKSLFTNESKVPLTKKVTPADSIHLDILNKYQILKERYSILYEEYKSDTFLQRNFLFFDLFRQILIILIVVVMFPLAFMQIVIINLVQFFFLISCYFIKPFETRFLKINFAISEIIITIAFISCLIIGIYDKIEMFDLEKRKTIGSIVPYCNLALLYWIFSTMLFKIMWKLFCFLNEFKRKQISV